MKSSFSTRLVQSSDSSMLSEAPSNTTDTQSNSSDYCMLVHVSFFGLQDSICSTHVNQNLQENT